MRDNLLSRHVFVFNTEDNGGEQLTLKTDMFRNGESDQMYCIQELCLESYRNSASFTLAGIVITPEKLRQLAYELEKKILLTEETLRDQYEKGC